jgi:RNA polymerase sigma factor (sigma-70 family)
MHIFRCWHGFCIIDNVCVLNVVMAGLFDIDELATKHSSRLYYFVLNRLRNHEDAQDVVQATYVAAIECEQSFLGQSKPETWLMGIALNLVRGRIHRHQKFGMSSLDEHDDWHEWTQDKADLEQHVENRAQIQKIAQVFEKMPEDMAHTASLVLIDNLSYQDAAEIEGIPIGTVRSRVSRAREFIMLEAA